MFRLKGYWRRSYLKTEVACDQAKQLNNSTEFTLIYEEPCKTQTVPCKHVFFYDNAKGELTVVACSMRSDCQEQRKMPVREENNIWRGAGEIWTSHPLFSPVAAPVPTHIILNP